MPLFGRVVLRRTFALIVELLRRVLLVDPERALCLAAVPSPGVWKTPVFLPIEFHALRMLPMFCSSTESLVSERRVRVIWRCSGRASPATRRLWWESCAVSKWCAPASCSNRSTIRRRHLY